MALWTPSNLSGSKLHRWIKGESFSHSGSTITGGTTSDSSATAISSSSWPSYNASGLNGYPTITSGGSNLMSLPVDIDYDWSVFVVVKPSALSSYHNVYEQSGDKSPMLWIDSSNRFSMNGAGAVIEPSTPTADGSTWRVVSTINRSSGTRAEERIDGTSRGTNVESVGSLNVGTGLTLKLLGRGSGNGLQGDLAELVITYGALTSDDEARIEGYLAWKYGLQSQLDSGHTYKSAAPTDGSSDSTGTGTGSGAASGIGAALFAGTGSGSGTGATGAVAGATHAGTGAATGVGALSMTGAAHWAATGSTVGAGAATGIGASTAAGAGTATGTGAAAGTGDSLTSGQATGIAVGTCTVIGIGSWLGTPVTTVSAPGGGHRRRPFVAYIDGRRVVGEYSEIMELVRQQARRHAESQPLKPGTKSAKKIARKQVMRVVPSAEPVPQAEMLPADWLREAGAAIEQVRNARATYVSEFVAKMMALAQQQIEDDNQAAIAAAEMML